MIIYFCATHFQLCLGLFISLIYLFKSDEQLETESVRAEQGDHEHEAPSAVTRSEQLAVTSRYNTAGS